MPNPYPVPAPDDNPNDWKSQYSVPAPDDVTDKKPSGGSVLKGWLDRKIEEQRAKQKLPFGKRLLQELGNVAMPAGDFGLLSAINKVVGDGEPAKASLGVLSPNAPTPASMVKGGVLDPALGLAQLATRVTRTGIAPVQRAVDAVHGYYKDNFDESPAGEAAGGVLTSGGYGSARGAATQFTKTAVTAGQKLLQIAKGASKGGVTAAATTSEANVKDDTDYINRKLQEFGLGSLLGGGATTAGYIGKGNPAARAFGDEATRNEAIARAEDIRSSTRSTAFPEGAEPSLGESLRSPNIQKIENATEYVPFSGAKARLEQQNNAIAAKLAELKAKGVEKSGPAGAGATISESADRLRRSRKAEYGAEYDAIRDAVDSSGARATPKEAISRAYEALHELEQTSGNAEAIGKIRNLITDLETGNYGDTFGKLQGERRNILRKTRDILNSGNPDSNLVRHNSAIAEGFSDDMNRTLAIADPTGQLKARLANTNTGYAGDVIAYKPDQPAGWNGYRSEARALLGKELFSDKVASKILSGDNPQMAQYVKHGTDAAGHEAVQGAVLQNIADSARGEAGLVSPKKGSNAVRDHENFIREFFPDADAAELNGFGKAMAALERSGQFMERLQTGKFSSAIGGQLGMGLGMFASPVGTASTIGLVRLFNKLSASKAGKEWLLNAAKMKPDSPELKAYLKQMPIIAGVGAGDVLE